MDEVLGHKPEVSPPVVVNSQSGVQMRSTAGSDNEQPSPATPASSRSRSRKRPTSDESPAAKRHRENMEFKRQAHEQFMEMMGKLIDKI